MELPLENHKEKSQEEMVKEAVEEAKKAAEEKAKRTANLGAVAASGDEVVLLAALIQAAGAKIGDTVKTVVFIKDMNDFAKVNEVYSKYFQADCPARSCVEVARLPKDVLIEIEAVVASSTAS